MDLALNNLQILICHETKPNKQIIRNTLIMQLLTDVYSYFAKLPDGELV